MEITNALRKTVKSLGDAKKRRETGLFVSEGTKCVLDTLGHFDCEMLIGTKAWLEAHAKETANVETITASRADMERMTQLRTAPEVLAVYVIPEHELDLSELRGKLTMALDRVQDPGNLGTIIRVCDWMGVQHILASEDTADVWNPKVVQATMGSVGRVQVHYTDLAESLRLLGESGEAVYGTFLDGDNIYDTQLSEGGVIVMGNEGRGISDKVAETVNRKLYIPPYPAGRETAESLNVAVATAITLSEFRRRL